METKMNFQTFWNTVKDNSHDFALKTLDQIGEVLNILCKVW